MNKTYYERINETLLHEQLENGLDVYFIPKNDYNKTYVTLQTNYGSFDNVFLEKGKVFKAPLGIAHYLEHKMFDMPDGRDAFQDMAKYGADCNAYTSYDKTCYLFSATENVYEATKKLLEFVFTPYFTDESVNKERGIIEQEIKMYMDYPEEKIRHQLLANMMHNHPIVNDVAGTVESISRITKENLRKCYDMFYQPQNMMMLVVGNFNPDDMIKVIKENCKVQKTQEIERINEEEPQSVIKEFDQGMFNIVKPKVYYGIKLPLLKIEEQARFEIALSIFLELLIGTSSAFYNRLLSLRLINANFNMDVLNVKSLNLITLEAETNEPNQLTEILSNYFSSIESLLFDNEDFKRIRNSILGSYIKAFNSLEGVSNAFARYYFMNTDLFKVIEILEALSMEDIKWIQSMFKKENSSFLIALPKQN